MNIPQVWEAEQEASRLPTKYLIPLQFQNCFQNCQDMPSKTTPGPPGTAWRGSNNLNSSPRGQVSNSAITFFPHFIFLCFYAHPKAFQNPDPTVFLKSIYQLHYSCPDIGGEKKKHSLSQNRGSTLNADFNSDSHTMDRPQQHSTFKLKTSS